jgi:nucleoside-diphosphate-sugar epimerase
VSLERASPGRVLITGGSGFIGGCLWTRFLELGWDVIATGRRPIARPGYVQHDLARPMPAALEQRFDVVIHAAARSSPWGRRREFAADNVDATKRILAMGTQHGLPRIIYVSSSSVYYQPSDQLAITEATSLPARQINLYSASKRQAEQLVQRYPGAWAIVRPRAVFGPGDTVLLPRILRAAAAGTLPLLKPKRGEVVGDLIYIDNLVDCIVRAALDRTISGCTNLTNNEPVPILAFLLEIFAKLGIPTPRRSLSVSSAMVLAGLLEFVYGVWLPAREPPITRFGVHVFAYSKTFDVSKMLATMGPPRVSVQEGVERTVAWVQGGGLSLTS